MLDYINLLQDSPRTDAYHNAMLQNLPDFQDKVVLDVGAGSGILSLFAVQAGAKRVYAVEASNMALHCQSLIEGNKLTDKIIMKQGKIEEVSVHVYINLLLFHLICLLGLKLHTIYIKYKVIIS